MDCGTLPELEILQSEAPAAMCELHFMVLQAGGNSVHSRSGWKEKGSSQGYT